MKSDDQVIQLFKAANPRPHPTHPSSEPPPIEALKMRMVELPDVDGNPIRDRRRDVLLASSLAGAAAVVGVFLVLGSSPGNQAFPPSTSSAVAAPGRAQAAPVAVAEAAMDAIARRDTAALRRLFGSEGTSSRADTIVNRVDWYAASDTRFDNISCRPDEGDSTVECSFELSNRISRFRELAPYPGTTTFEVADGSIEQVVERIEYFGNWAQAILPFMGWVQETYPEQFDVVFNDPPDGWPRTTPQALGLYETLSIEYTSGETVPVSPVRAFLSARSSGDASTLGGALGPSPDIADLWIDGSDDLPGLFSLFDRTGWKWLEEGCDIPDRSVRPALVVCELRVGVPWAGPATIDPPSSATITFRLEDGRIAATELSYDIASLEQSMTAWLSWLESSHPGDVERLYELVDGYHTPRLDEETLDLFEIRTREFLSTR
ncbi:MAG: hypothetical protein OEX04_09760 [Acidimicrobiia bacterium]|nr:hypothetical protein [Acidimicrobiia bacterium]